MHRRRQIVVDKYILLFHAVCFYGVSVRSVIRSPSCSKVTISFLQSYGNSVLHVELVVNCAGGEEELNEDTFHGTQSSQFTRILYIHREMCVYLNVIFSLSLSVQKHHIFLMIPVFTG